MGYTIDDIEKIQQEKEKLESIVDKPVVGNRVHFLKYDTELPNKWGQIPPKQKGII